jgi:Holliday junction DNA helicase RuvA
VIARISGRLEEITESAALVNTGDGLWYEVLIPACDLTRLSDRTGQEVVLHTIHYVEGDPSRGGQTPRLIGFCSETDRAFFRLFTTVKGIGVRKALRALVRPLGEIAAAIQNKDTAMLLALPEIGKRTAETVIAELHGKVDEFAAESVAMKVEVPPAGTEALAVLVQLGERRSDAAALVERVLAVAPELDSPEAIIQQAYRLKAGGT